MFGKNWCVCGKGFPPWYAGEGVFWAYEGFVVIVVVSFLGFGLPGSSFYCMFLVVYGVRRCVLDVIEPGATSQLVSRYGGSIFGGLGGLWVCRCSF